MCAEKSGRWQKLSCFAVRFENLPSDEEITMEQVAESIRLEKPSKFFLTSESVQHSDVHSKESFASLRKEPAPYQVLVVDDEQPFAEMMRIFLQYRYLTVDIAANGREAQDLIRLNKYDLIISDVFMPELDGMTLLRWIKKRQPETDVILMTGRLSHDGKTEARNHGASGFLTKPFSTHQLLTAIERCRQKRISPDAAADPQVALLLKPLIHDMAVGLENAVIMLKLLQRDFPETGGDKTAPPLDAILNNLFRLMGLTEEYWSLALCLDEKGIIPTDQLDLQVDVIEHVLREWTDEIRRKNISVTYQCDKSVTFVPRLMQANRILLRGAFRTLFGNAVRCCHSSSAITYYFKDGETRQEVHIVFEGFQPQAEVVSGADSSAASAGNGTGYCNGGEQFGLAMADSVVRHYGGSLSSEPWQDGYRFIVVLPR
jgi:CheY-like chemotaxis protein